MNNKHYEKYLKARPYKYATCIICNNDYRSCFNDRSQEPITQGSSCACYFSTKKNIIYGHYGSGFDTSRLFITDKPDNKFIKLKQRYAHLPHTMCDNCLREGMSLNELWLDRQYDSMAEMNIRINNLIYTATKSKKKNRKQIKWAKRQAKRASLGY